MSEQQRLLSLVPVGLREAVIDSPPFRASVRHFEDQVDGLEKWLESYLKILSDWLNGLQRTSSLASGLILGLEEYTTVLCARAAPGFLAEGLIGLFTVEDRLTGDPDYTFLAMTRFADGLKQFWGKIFGMVGCCWSMLTTGERNTRVNDYANDKIAERKCQGIQGDVFARES